MRPTIALLTDFGLRDHYVGALKGAILTVAPEAQIVDVLHEIAPHDVEGGAYALGAAYAAFPAGTVFVAVVDPGVGSARRGLAVEAAGLTFVGPDNGILTPVLEDHPGARVHALTNRGLWRPEIAATFHGRDIFGPVAGHLALGLALQEVGPVATDPHRLTGVAVRAVGPDEWEGTIVAVDRFGQPGVQHQGARAGRHPVAARADPSDFVVVVWDVIAPLVRTYADVQPGEPCALVGSSDRLEIAVNGGRAAAFTGAGRGARVTIRRVYQPAM